MTFRLLQVIGAVVTFLDWNRSSTIKSVEIPPVPPTPPSPAAWFDDFPLTLAIMCLSNIVIVSLCIWLYLCTQACQMEKEWCEKYVEQTETEAWNTYVKALFDAEKVHWKIKLEAYNDLMSTTANFLKEAEADVDNQCKEILYAAKQSVDKYLTPFEKARISHCMKFVEILVAQTINTTYTRDELLQYEVTTFFSDSFENCYSSVKVEVPLLQHLTSLRLQFSQTRLVEWERCLLRCLFRVFLSLSRSVPGTNPGEYNPFGGWQPPVPPVPNGGQHLTNRRGASTLDHRKSNSIGGASDTGSAKSFGRVTKNGPSQKIPGSVPDLLSPPPGMAENISGFTASVPLRSSPAQRGAGNNWDQRQEAPVRRQPAAVPPPPHSNDFFTGYEAAPASSMQTGPLSASLAPQEVPGSYMSAGSQPFVGNPSAVADFLAPQPGVTSSWNSVPERTSLGYSPSEGFGVSAAAVPPGAAGPLVGAAEPTPQGNVNVTEAAAKAVGVWGFLSTWRDVLWQTTAAANPGSPGGLPLHQIRFGAGNRHFTNRSEGKGCDEPFREPSSEVTDNNDLAGPIVFAIAIATLLLVQGKVEFSAVYAQIIIGAIGFRVMLSLLSGAAASLVFVVSSLGYALLPSLILAVLRAGQFWLLGSTAKRALVPVAVAMIMWSAWSASSFMSFSFMLFLPLLQSSRGFPKRNFLNSARQEETSGREREGETKLSSALKKTYHDPGIRFWAILGRGSVMNFPVGFLFLFVGSNIAAYFIFHFFALSLVLVPPSMQEGAYHTGFLKCSPTTLAVPRAKGTHDEWSCSPLAGREREFESVLSFVQDQWSCQKASRVLFVYGACGCGKTSTVLRALRLCVDKPIPSDLVPPNPPHEMGQKRLREDVVDEDTNTSARSSGSLSSISSGPAAEARSRGAHNNAASPAPRCRSHWEDKFPDFMSRKTGARRVLAHYLNCADLTAPQLIENIISSIRHSCPRPDLSTRGLLEILQGLSTKGKAARLPELDKREISYKQVSSMRSAGRVRGPLHILAMDEVEYARLSGRDIISHLASFAAHNPDRLALIFISNQRHLVHVPPSMLEELCFEAYSVAQLKAIAQAAAEKGVAEVVKNEEHRMLLRITPSLLEYIARKALLEFSGDARQVIAMTRRVVYAGAEQLTKKVVAAESAKAKTSKGQDIKKASLAEVKSLMSVIDAYAPPEETSGDQAHSNTRNNISVAAGVGKAADGASDRIGASSPTRTLSLASSIRLLRSCAVEEEAERYISTMTEQMAYVLSCLVVLRLQQQQEEHRRRGAASGISTPALHAASYCTAVAISSRSSRNAISMRELHTLYSTLMMRRHFPSMNPSGIASAVDGLADMGIVTRPQRRGNETLFSLNGTWSVEAMESALAQRGEVLRKEMEACGLDSGENRFASVLFELKRIAGLV
eukprot:gene3974-2833_t